MSASAKRPNALDKAIGARLLVMRQQAGMSQADMVVQIQQAGLSVTQAQLSHYERGENKVPASLLAIAAPILRCKVGEFFDFPPISRAAMLAASEG
ncbi:helix-turn-helix domain-containing protein [Pseudomonas juntendi]|jgi:transcriptional regulator with XRE-family HTH domain|uniref:helix-turn-helix domain-containing protein n=1 Tax=Pseudomonas TaxID=286 RepID=UPI001F472BA2|nr:helix-turn-helix domain-containing protein [Pseudomonas juntendi]MCO7058256.1 helix-turn-helix domain-containing protein [Pseudomonas juntendi]UJM15228.1 helix-turn-helix domain-containing protein [Pseudomonas juntendi]